MIDPHMQDMIRALIQEPSATVTVSAGQKEVTDLDKARMQAGSDIPLVEEEWIPTTGKTIVIEVHGGARRIDRHGRVVME
jgi:hypothetical protein